jgi:L-aminopeptidase/D-esterase-like protein
VKDAITDVTGILVGHAQNLAAGTGCTVVLCPGGAVTGVDVRGGAPGTRETDALRADCTVPCAHAVFLSGGSAYGLSCATGIMRWLEERHIGFNVGVTVVPIVPGAVLFDLGLGDSKVRPDAEMGYRACENASSGNTQQGNVGAGTGATIGWLPLAGRGTMKGGLGTASLRSGPLVVGAIVAVNCIGDVRDPDTGEVLGGVLAPDGTRIAGAMKLLAEDPAVRPEGPTTNTTIGVVATNAILTKSAAHRVAMMAQDGLPRTIEPVHTLRDGDAVFSMGTGEVEADITRVGALCARVMARAIANAVKAAETLHGVPAWRDLRPAS